MSVVCVQLVPVFAGAAHDAVLVGRLGAGEWEAIRSLGFAADRDRAVTARATARLELGRRLGIQPGRVPLQASAAGGAPLVAGTSLTVSWSHSGDWVALAVTEGRSVGVDIERLPASTPTIALRRIGVQSMQEFVDCEAIGKVLGQGLTTSRPPDVSVRPVEAPVGYVAAVAAPGDDWILDLRAPEPAPPFSASAGAIGAWDFTGTGRQGRGYVAARRRLKPKTQTPEG